MGVGGGARYSALLRDFGMDLTLDEPPDVGYCAGKGLDEIVLQSDIFSDRHF